MIATQTEPAAADVSKTNEIDALEQLLSEQNDDLSRKRSGDLSALATSLKRPKSEDEEKSLIRKIEALESELRNEGYNYAPDPSLLQVSVDLADSMIDEEIEKDFSIIEATIKAMDLYQVRREIAITKKLRERYLQESTGM